MCSIGRLTRGHLALILLLTLASPARSDPPATVWPGANDKVVVIDQSCPTFTWKGVAGADGYELVLYQVQQQGSEFFLPEEGKARFWRRLPAENSSWTPSLKQCLEYGDVYAWAVRALTPGEQTEWSEISIFQVTAAGRVPGLSLAWPINLGGPADLGQDYAQFGLGSATRHHTGLDISGSSVAAAAPGVVDKIFDCGDCIYNGDPRSDNHIMQNVVILRHSLAGGGTAYSLYAHLGSIAAGLFEGQSVSTGHSLGTTGVWCGRCVPSRFLNHVHFEIKDRAVLHNPTNNGVQTPSDEPGGLCTQPPCYWGYTPTNPDQNGYHDPVLNMHQVSSISESRVRVTPDGQGVNMRTGPSNYRALRTTSSGEEFLAVRSSGATTTPACDAGWYQILPTELSFQTQLVDGIRYFNDPTRSSSAIPDAWICRGNGGEVWIESVEGETLSVSLTANPQSGTEPLESLITATVSGTATGTINYTFWWNCDDPGTSVGAVMNSCGSIPTPSPGQCAVSVNGFKCDAVAENPKVVGHTYSNAGTFTAKVIAERGAAPPAEDRFTIAVSSLFNYSLSNSGSVSVFQGSWGATTISRTLLSGSSEPVGLSASGLPSGASSSFTNNPCSPTCSSTLNISTSPATPQGTYLILVTGTPLNKTTSFNLEISAAPGDCEVESVTGLTVTSSAVYEACDRVHAGSGVTVSSTGELRLAAGRLVSLGSGVVVEGKLRISSCGHNLCQVSVDYPLVSGCHSCVTAICSVDSWCCNNNWDSVCVGRVSSICGLVCP